MNKIYSLLSIMAVAGCFQKISAQNAATITATALPQTGYMYTMASDTMPSDVPSFSVTAGSTSYQTWDYSGAFANTYGENTSFVTPAGNPGASSFPNATLAVSQGGGDWGYFISNANGLVLDGGRVVLFSDTAIADYVPNQIIIPTPFTYSSSPVNNVYGATFTVSVAASPFPITVTHRANRTISVDAFGSLTTPAGTYTNTIRVKTYETTSDTATSFGTVIYSAMDTTTDYTWYQNTQDAQLMTISLDKGVTKKGQYLLSFSNGIASIKQTTLSASLFPNPTSNTTSLVYENTVTAKVSVNLFDISGRQIATLVNNQQQGVGKQQLLIDVNTLRLSIGLYFVQLTINGATQTIKLNVR